MSKHPWDLATWRLSVSLSHGAGGHSGVLEAEPECAG